MGIRRNQQTGNYYSFLKTSTFKTLAPTESDPDKALFPPEHATDQLMVCCKFR